MELPDLNICSPFSPWVCTVWKEGQGKASLLWSHSHRKHLLLNIWCGIKPIPGTRTQPFPWLLPHRKFRKEFWEEGRWPVGCRWHSNLRVELLGAGSGELSMDPSAGGQEGALSYPSCASFPGKLSMRRWECWNGKYRVSNPESTFVPFGHRAVAAALTFVSLPITERWEHVFHGSWAWSVQGYDSAPSEPLGLCCRSWIGNRARGVLSSLPLARDSRAVRA